MLVLLGNLSFVRAYRTLIFAAFTILFCINSVFAQKFSSSGYSVYDTGDTVYTNAAASGPGNNLPVPQGCPTTNNITTPLNQNNAQRGIMFDVTALTNITISCFDVNMAAGTSPVQIYFKTGTHVGFQNNAAAWTLLGTANNVTGLGSNVLTPVPININVGVTAGCTVAFYITRTTQLGPTLYYTNGTAVGNVYSSNANLQIKDGTGKDYPFGASFQPRRFNGKIYYNVNPSSTASITGPSSMCAGTTQQYNFVGSGWTGFNWTVPPGTVITAGQGTQTITVTAGATSGNICCTPSNACGPGAQVCLPVTINPLPTITASQTNLTCNSVNNGSATATVSPAGTYTYAWSPAVSTGATATNLGAGVYSVTVTSTSGCTRVQTFTITQPPAITLTPTQTNVACNGGNTGSASVVATGGNGVYSYSWAPFGGTGATATGLSAGSYTVTVSSPVGCTSTQTFNITQPPAITLTPTQTNVACNGGNTGSASVNATGGTGVYTYSWTPSGGTGATATGIVAGSYTVMVSSPVGCTATQTFNITQPPAITLTPTQTNVACNGGSTGSASVTATGGNGAYTYAWSPSGGNAATATGLIAGPYSVVVTDANGCTATQTFNITQPPALTLTSTQTNVACNGGNTGSASVNAAGGTGAYTYAWSPSGGNAATATGLIAGAYSVVVTDANGCTATQTFNITQPNALTLTPTQTNVACNGGNTGSASVTAAGGNGVYTYAWSPSGGNAATATGLIAGAYSVVVTDANGCTATQTFNITQPPALTLTSTQTNVACNGGNTGSASVTAAGGTGVYTYAWSPSGGNAATATGLIAGSYSVVVTDANGCTATQTFNITQPPALTLTSTQTNVACNGGNTGSASVTAAGGTGVYTYAWSPSGGNAATATGLVAGPYSVVVTDANGCTATQTFNITQPPALTLTSTQTNVACSSGNTGSASVTAAGGTGVYTYAWSPSGGNAATATGLIAGAYSVVVTDANGCTATQTFNITQPPALTLTSTQTNVACNGGNTGSASVTATGGTGVYTYAWAPSGGNAATATGLIAGAYSVVVTDANGCTATQTFNITQPPALTLTSTQTNVACNGGNTGSASVTAAGGTGVYTYAWSPSGGNAATATGLVAGAYSVVVTDANGCTATQTFNITQPPALVLTPTQTNVACSSGNTGSASVAVVGGTGAYTYAWSPSGGNAATASGLIAGAYSVVVTDANGCTATQTFNITQPTGLVLTPTQTNVACFNGNTGSATVSATGGTGAYTYAWSPSGGNAATATGLIAGSYSVVVTDANGCTATQTFNITQPNALTTTPTQTNVACFNGNTGSATVSATGGTGVYTYAWAPSGGNAATATGLIAGAYSVVVTDANGCTATQTFNITQPPALTLTSTQTNVACNGGNTGSASATAAGGTGVYTYAWSPSGGNAATATGLIAGAYSVVVTDANGCTATQTFNITQPPALTLTSTQTNVACSSGNTGSASVTAVGGTGVYTYAWSPSGGNASTATGLIAGAYSVIVTDANGCTATQTFNITQPAGMVITATQTNVACFNGNTGSASVSVTGGTGVYTYAWSPSGGNASSASGLIAGPYSVVVTDANGCTATQTFNITQPNALTLTATQTNVACNGGNTGSASVTAAGGTGVYTYAWSPSGGNAATATGLIAGAYSVVVTDANGCTATQTFNITQPPALTLTSTQTNVACNGGNTGSASVTAAGGTGVYTYTWSPSGGNASTATGLIAGAYSVVVTDANGCTATQTFNITQPPALTAVTSFTQSTCNNANGSAAVVASGGTGAYTYQWSPSGGTGSTASALIAGIYTVVVTDVNNCTVSATINVQNASAPTSTITATTPVSCFGGNDGSATVTASGGTAPYTYAWTPSGGTGATEISLIAGNYSVVVTDANGCTTTASTVITEPTALSGAINSSPALCFGGNSGSASVVASGGTAAYTYAWSPSGGNNASASALIAGSYSVTITDANGCSLSVSTTVTEPTAVATAMSATPSLCFGGNTGTATVIASGGTAGYSYAWSPFGGNASTASTLVAGNYTVTVTDANGCTTTDTVNVNEPSALSLTTQSTDASCNQSDGSVSVQASGGTGPYAYQWASPNGPATSTWSNIPAGSYTVLVTDANGCFDTISQIVNTSNAVLTSVNSTSNVLCFGANDGAIDILVTGGTPGYTYAWTPNVSSSNNATGIPAGNYTVTVTDAIGCTSSISVSITQPTQLNVSASASATNVCQGTSVTLSSTTSGGTPAYTSVWMPGNLVGNTQTVIPTASTTYTFAVVDANGCADSAIVFVRVNPIPVAGLTANVVAGCAPVCVSFTDNSTVTAPGIITAWSWDFGDGNTANTASPSHCYNTPGNYTVILQVTTTDGCTETMTMSNYINVFAVPVADFNATPQPATMVNNTISFTDQSSNASQWIWSFGDILNSTSNVQNPQFTYNSPECFSVELEVISANGCTDTASDIICIEPDVTIYVPNTFTPDGNGINELFFPAMSGIDPDKYELRIFDRWGNQIFVSTDPSEGWDGTVQGTNRLCQQDTYVWALRVTDLNGKMHIERGIVNLIR